MVLYCRLSVAVTFHLMYVQIIFSSVYVVEWPPFGKSCSLGCPYVLFVFCLFVIRSVISRFGFEGRIWILIAQVPGHCLHFTFIHNQDDCVIEVYAFSGCHIILTNFS